MAVEWLWIAIVLLVLAGLWWIGYRLEPHWVSRDGQRFMCGTQEFFHGTTAGHPRETQVALLPDGAMHITHKRMMRRQRSVWQLVGKSADPPKGLEIYVAQQTVDGNARPEMMALRIPKKSRCVAILDAELARLGFNIDPPGTT